MKKLISLSAFLAAFSCAPLAFAGNVLLPQGNTANPYVAAPAQVPVNADSTSSAVNDKLKTKNVETAAPIASLPNTPNPAFKTQTTQPSGTAPNIYQPYIAAAQKQAQAISQFDAKATQDASATAGNPALAKSQEAYQQFQESQAQALKLGQGQMGTIPAVYQNYLLNAQKQTATTAQQDGQNVQQAVAIANDPKLANDPAVMQQFLNNIAAKP